MTPTLYPSPVRVAELATPALVVDRGGLDANVAAMATRWPGTALRPHVKAFKSTALAARLAAAGHTAMCAATTREIVGLAGAGLGEDLLLANEVVDPSRLAELGQLVQNGSARITVAVDSSETIDAAAAAGVVEVLIDVNVGLPRGGCAPDDAEALATRARAAGLTVRGVMGYEGHLMIEHDEAARADGVAASMAVLRAAHERVGGDVVSGGGTGTWALNTWVTELQAGSFTLMDTAYAAMQDLPFRPAVAVAATVVSVNRSGYAVADAGLKSLGMDHGNPAIDGASVWFCSDEHTTFAPVDGARLPAVGDRVLVWPAHIDPTLALHEVLHVVDGPLPRALTPPAGEAEVLDIWAIDLRGW
jgi:D-serine deaminase-like pyridoxal phosphate-dependent protein